MTDEEWISELSRLGGISTDQVAFIWEHARAGLKDKLEEFEDWHQTYQPEMDKLREEVETWKASFKDMNETAIGLTEKCNAYRKTLKICCYCHELSYSTPGPCDACEVLSRFEKKEGK